jgi:23S rRNA (uracil1939-C5)-methyltransferase
MLRPGELIDLTIEKPVAGGRMLARHEGQVILVAGTLPREKVRARIEKVTRGVVMAMTTEIVEADAERRQLEGDPSCGGQVYAHVNYPRQLTFKASIVEDAFARIARMPLPSSVRVAASEERGYRMRSRLHVRGAEVGFFREGTHDLCDAGATGQLLPGAVDAARNVVRQWSGQRSGRIAAVEVSENIPGSERAIHLELERGDSAPPTPMARSEDIGVTGISAGPASDGRAFVVAGEPYVSDPIDALVPNSSAPANATLRRHAHAFFQGNRYLVRELVSRVLAQVGGDPVLDLYAGVGLFAIALAAAGHDRITAIEIDATSAQDLAANAAAFPSALHVVHDKVERVLAERNVDRPATVIVDPPRTGMSREALDGVIGCRAPKIVYVSCDVATLARDARRLVDAGYALEHVEAFDLFPNTAHVEVLAAFRGLH